MPRSAMLHRRDSASAAGVRQRRALDQRPRKPVRAAAEPRCRARRPAPRSANGRAAPASHPGGSGRVSSTTALMMTSATASAARSDSAVASTYAASSPLRELIMNVRTSSPRARRKEVVAEVPGGRGPECRRHADGPSALSRIRQRHARRNERQSMPRPAASDEAAGRGARDDPRNPPPLDAAQRVVQEYGGQRDGDGQRDRPAFAGPPPSEEPRVRAAARRADPAAVPCQRH